MGKCSFPQVRSPLGLMLTVPCYTDSVRQPLCANGMALPLQNATVDIMTCRAVLHHISHIATALRDICRVQRPGGQLLI